MIPVVTRIRRALRTARATIEAIATSAATMATGGTRGQTRTAQLQRGDRAPDFTLPGSDGVTYRLADLLGRGETIVIAWFPKAFTGG